MKYSVTPLPKEKEHLPRRFLWRHRESCLSLVPIWGWDSGQVEVLGVLQLNVCAKRLVKHFTGFCVSTRAIGHRLFDADDLMALRALAEAMTRAIHFLLWSKPSRVGQFWLFHAPSFPH